MFDRLTGMAVSHRYGHPVEGWKIRVYCDGYETNLTECRQPYYPYWPTQRTVFISCNNTGT